MTVNLLKRLGAFAGREIRLSGGGEPDGRGWQYLVPLWWPVFLASGIGLYFALPVEPRWDQLGWPIAGLLLVLFILWPTPLRRLLISLSVPVFLVAAGLAVTMLRVDMVGGPILQKKTAVDFTGTIVLIEADARGYGRVLFRDIEFKNGDLTDQTQKVGQIGQVRQVRLAVNFPVAAYQPGDRVSVRAVLLPLPGPVEPGGFDVARQLWFDGIGAVGFVLAPLEVTGAAPRLTDRINSARFQLANDYLSRFDEPYGGFAAALTTGIRRAIPEQDLEAMRKAGLAHMLAISGLHMGLVMGGVFFLVRLLVAAVPAVALNWRGDRIAAIVALLVGGGYLLMAGGSVPTVRAFIMALVAFGALFLDRRPISLRSVMLAALIILLIMPESLIEAGFQMSFAAVIALVAGYESLMRWRPELLSRTAGQWRLAGNVRIYLVGLMVTSLIAGLATMPIAAFHFGRISHFGLLANALAVPLLGLVVLPGLMLDAVMGALGLHVLTGWLVEAGLMLILDVAHWVSSLPGATEGIPAGAGPALPLLALAGLWLCLWQGRLRLLAVVPAVAALLLWTQTERPFILADRDGALVGLLPDQGVRQISGSLSSYSADRWAQADGLGDEGAFVRAKSCDRQGCVIPWSGGLLAHPKTMAAVMEDCRRADILITSLAVPKYQCRGPAVIIDKWNFWRGGAHRVTKEKGPPDDGPQWVVRSANEMRGRRPWVPKHQWPPRPDRARSNSAGQDPQDDPVP